jgi:exo-beta-1,3-glucanase (GH17 family)
MSSKSRVHTALSGQDFSHMLRKELRSIFLKTLNEGIHGISFSVYLEHQSPGSQISEEQIRERMEIIQPYVKWIRSFSCTDGNEQVPRIAHEYGIKTLVGAWLGDDVEKNEAEIEGILQVAGSGHADMVAVGNEVLLRGDLTENQIIEYILRVKKEIPDIPVGYVDAYYEFNLNPRITEACDVIMANCYPFWEGYPIEHSFLYMKEMYHRAVKAGKGKRVIISETGWPNLGSPVKLASPSFENAVKYFINAYSWAKEENLELFYFSSFDETWKIDAEGDVGAYWGLWDKDGNLKYG